MRHERISRGPLPHSPIKHHFDPRAEGKTCYVLHRVRNFLLLCVLSQSQFLDISFFLSQKEVVELLELLLLLLVLVVKPLYFNLGWVLNELRLVLLENWLWKLIGHKWPFPLDNDLAIRVIRIPDLLILPSLKILTSPFPVKSSPKLPHPPFSISPHPSVFSNERPYWWSAISAFDHSLSPSHTAAPLYTAPTKVLTSWEGLWTPL